MAKQIVASDVDADVIASIRKRMLDVVTRHLGGRPSSDTEIAGLSVHRATSPVEPSSYFFEPSFSFIVRGAKRVVLGDETYAYDQSHFLLTAVDLPTVVQVFEASEDNPYISVMQKIDLDLARCLITELDSHRGEQVSNDAGLSLGPVTVSLAAATMNLLDLLDTPADAPLLAPYIQREILFRLLNSPVGGRLRQAVQIGTRTNGVSKAIQWIRENFHQPLRVEHLASIAGMGESTLHHHFRALTTMSPLQYQKQLRLHEARRLMINDKIDASVAAHRVGYESATQFNREYRRLFGIPPKRDVRTIMTTDQQPYSDDGFPETARIGSTTLQ